MVGFLTIFFTCEYRLLLVLGIRWVANLGATLLAFFPEFPFASALRGVPSRFMYARPLYSLPFDSWHCHSWAEQLLSAPKKDYLGHYVSRDWYALAYLIPFKYALRIQFWHSLHAESFRVREETWAFDISIFEWIYMNLFENMINKIEVKMFIAIDRYSKFGIYSRRMRITCACIVVYCPPISNSQYARSIGRCCRHERSFFRYFRYPILSCAHVRPHELCFPPCTRELGSILWRMLAWQNIRVQLLQDWVLQLINNGARAIADE